MREREREKDWWLNIHSLFLPGFRFNLLPEASLEEMAKIRHINVFFFLCMCASGPECILMTKTHTHKMPNVCSCLHVVIAHGGPCVPSLIGCTEKKNAGYDWWRAACGEEWLCKENSKPWMIYAVCSPVIISCSITTLYVFTHHEPGVMEVEGKKKKTQNTTDRAHHEKSFFSFLFFFCFPGSQSCIMIYVQNPSSVGTTTKCCFLFP